MFYYIYGMDAAEPDKCADIYADLGIRAVVAPPNENCVEALSKRDIETWVCFGAFSRGGYDDSVLSEDSSGHKGEWFSSGCPNEERLYCKSMAVALKKAADWGATAVISDGCRFASPEPEGRMFDSCFCPRCMEKGTRLGFDMEKMRADVSRAKTSADAALPDEWFAFRASVIRERMDELAEAAKKAGLRPGAFVFPASLGKTVGQTAAAVRSLDILAPMLYRAYPYSPAIACLNGEYASLRDIFRRRGDSSPAQSVMRLTGKRIDDHADIRRRGFEPDVIADETADSRKSFANMLMPILQAEDTRLRETIARCAEGGADGIGFFAYSRENIKYIENALWKG